VQVHPDLLRVLSIQCVLGIDEGAGAPDALHLGDDLQRQRRLARGLRPVDLHHAATRQPADAQRDIQAERAGGDDLNVALDLFVGQPHDRAAAELLLNL